MNDKIKERKLKVYLEWNIKTHRGWRMTKWGYNKMKWWKEDFMRLWDVEFLEKDGKARGWEVEVFIIDPLRGVMENRCRPEWVVKELEKVREVEEEERKKWGVIP